MFATDKHITGMETAEMETAATTAPHITFIVFLNFF